MLSREQIEVWRKRLLQNTAEVYISDINALCDMALASACPPPASADKVEHVARAIDPVAWEYYDRYPERYYQIEPSLTKARAAIAAYERLSAARAPDKS